MHFKIFLPWRNNPSGPRPPHYRRFMIILRHTILGRTPLDEESARRRDLYLTTHNSHNRQTSMPPAGFEPTIPTSNRPQTHALDRAATGIGSTNIKAIKRSNSYSETGLAGHVGCVGKPREKKSVLRHRFTRKENIKMDALGSYDRAT